MKQFRNNPKQHSWSLPIHRNYPLQNEACIKGSSLPWNIVALDLRSGHQEKRKGSDREISESKDTYTGATGSRKQDKVQCGWQGSKVGVDGVSLWEAESHSQGGEGSMDTHCCRSWGCCPSGYHTAHWWAGGTRCKTHVLPEAELWPIKLKPLEKVEARAPSGWKIEIIYRDFLLRDSQNDVVSSFSYKERITGLYILMRALIDIVYWFVYQPPD